MNAVAAARANLTALRTRNAPMRERGAAILRLEAAIRAEGPELSFRHQHAVTPVCCSAATVDYTCTCGHVVRCAEHGDKHRGTHS